MIINGIYDKSLWLMLCSDRVNRGNIINFLKSVPEEFYVKLRDSLGFYANGEINFSINRSFLNGEVRTSSDMRYWYIIEPKTGSLSFGEAVVVDDKEYELFNMILYPFDENIFNNDKGYIDCLIGKITNNYLDDYLNDIIKVHLIGFPFCDVIVSSSNDYAYKKNKYRLVDLDRMPDNFSLGDLKNDDCVKKLIRGKKNSR